MSNEWRKNLKPEDYAAPAKEKLPIRNTPDDPKHVRMAWDMVDNTKDLSDEERKEARSRILRRAKELGIETKNWNIKAAMQLQAMSLNISVDDDHPNKMPFSGVLTKVDELSDKPPSGSGGKLVMLTRGAVEASLESLLGMGVDLADNFDSHDPQKKVGIITSADLVGNEVQIEGFIYASDFPDEAEYIQEHKDDLGFSYEVKRVFVASLDEPTLTVTGLTFTGAAILKKKDAAYTSTSLSAQADAETDMTKEEFEALMNPFKTALDALSASVKELEKKGVAAPPQSAASVAHLVKPHSDAIRAAAAGMEKAGLGLHEKRGHVAQLRGMADCMDAEAAMGKLPHTFEGGGAYYAAADQNASAEAVGKAVADALKPVNESIAALKTQFGDLQAKAFEKAAPAERKTLPPSVTAVLQKAGIQLDAAGDKQFTVAEVDKMLKDAGIRDLNQRINFKSQLAAAGRLAN